MIKVCFITDENYVVPTMTAIKSIELNSKGSRVSCFVVTNNISKESRECLKSLSNKTIQVEVLDVENKYETVGVDHGHVSRAAMLKFSLCDIFKNFDKILYIDSDTLILNDLTRLFNTDIDGFYAAVVEDMLACHGLGFNKDVNLEKYFNSGVMLLNLKKMREDNIPLKLLENKQKDKIKRFMDQDAFNVTFNSNVKFISLKFNLMKANLNYSVDEIASFYQISKEELKNAFNKPVILHLTHAKKPWKDPSAVAFARWLYYFLMLPDSKIKKRGIKNLFKTFGKMTLDEIYNLIKKLAFIFSITDSKEKNHKVVNLFGLKIKINRLFFHPIFPRSSRKSALLVEANNSNADILSGVAKYFLDLGFDVDVLVHPAEYALLPLIRLKNKKVRCYDVSFANIKKLLNKEKFIQKYDYIYLNTEYPHERFLLIPADKEKILQMWHHLDWIKDLKTLDRKTLMLHKFPSYDNGKYFEVAPCYYGDVKIFDKNKVTKFVVANSDNDFKCNYTYLIDAVRKIVQNGIDAFKITVAVKNNDFPLLDGDIAKYFNLVHGFSYEKMYDEIEKADFILPLLDKNSPDDEKFLTNTNSSSIALAFGFITPCLVEEKFALEYGLNNRNSILYNDGDDLTDAILTAIKMSDDEYALMQNQLKGLADYTYQNSIQELKKALEN